MIARLASFAVVLAVVFAGTRLIVRALPGDPLETLMAETGTSVPSESLRAELGLDRPFFPAMASDLARALRGDLGISIITRQPIAPLLVKRLGRTAELSALALLLGLSAALALGLAAAAQPGSGIDRICSAHGALAAALPSPWLGPLLLLAIGSHGGVWLPAFSLAWGFSGLWARLIRQRVREGLGTQFAAAARARGLGEWRVRFKYGLIPVSGPLLAYLGTQIGGLLAGAFVTEIIFDWQGMGSLFVQAVLRRDYPTVEAAAFVAAALSLGGTLLGDLAQRGTERGTEHGGEAG